MVTNHTDLDSITDIQSSPDPSRVGALFKFGGQLFATFGVATVAYLLALKVAQIPCIGGSCSEVFNGRYSSIFGIPLPFFGLVAWAAFCSPWGRARAISGMVLAFAGICLFLLQAFVLKQFCALCCLHSIFAVGSFCFSRANKAFSFQFIIGIIISWVMFFVTGEVSFRDLTRGSPIRSDFSTAAPTARDFEGFGWLGDVAVDSDLLVVSFTCRHCVEALYREIQDNSGPMKRPRPKIMILASGGNLETNKTVLAAILALSKPDGEKAGFRKAMAILKVVDSDMIAAKPTKVIQLLEKQCPEYRAYLVPAERVLLQHRATLRRFNVRATPFYLTINGEGRYRSN